MWRCCCCCCCFFGLLLFRVPSGRRRSTEAPSKHAQRKGNKLARNGRESSPGPFAGNPCRRTTRQNPHGPRSRQKRQFVRACATSSKTGTSIWHQAFSLTVRTRWPSVSWCRSSCCRSAASRSHLPAAKVSAACGVCETGGKGRPPLGSFSNLWFGFVLRVWFPIYCAQEQGFKSPSRQPKPPIRGYLRFV